MTQDRPTAAELVQAVREFLEHDVMTTSTDKRVQFHARVAANALGMIERELAARIRDGSLDDRLDAVREHVRATVYEKLLVANPGYLSADPSA